MSTEQTTPTTSGWTHLESDEYRATTSHHEAGERDGEGIDGSRALSIAAGGILALFGTARRDIPGLVVAAVGATLIFSGATGRRISKLLSVDPSWLPSAKLGPQHRGTHVTQSFLINKPASELYAFWRRFENLPQIMTHLEEVRIVDDRISHWVVTAPTIAGGHVEWDAELTADEPDKRIEWQSLPDSDVQSRGMVMFLPAPGDRGTIVKVELEYAAPAGTVGEWTAKLFGESPEQQIREDLRNFKRTMEIGEVPSTTGQPRGTCLGRGRRETA